MINVLIFHEDALSGNVNAVADVEIGVQESVGDSLVTAWLQLDKKNTDRLELSGHRLELAFFLPCCSCLSVYAVTLSKALNLQVCCATCNFSLKG